MAKLPGWRRALIHIVRQGGRFDIIILAVIIFSSLTLALDGPMNNPDAQSSRVLPSPATHAIWRHFEAGETVHQEGELPKTR